MKTKPIKAWAIKYKRGFVVPSQTFKKWQVFDYAERFKECGDNPKVVLVEIREVRRKKK